MAKHNLLASDVDLQHLAELTKNYTGAEIEGDCRSATSFALFNEAMQNPSESSSQA
jgi:vesicle-fusing ATPase